MKIKHLKKYINQQARQGHYMIIDSILMGLVCYGRYKAYDKVLKIKKLI